MKRVPSTSRARALGVALRLLAAAAILPAFLAEGGEPPGAAPPPNLHDVKIKDVATWVSVPLPQEKSVVIGLPERFWIQCPRHSVVTPTALEGDGTVLEFMNARGGTHSVLYVGAVTLPEPISPEKIEVRAEKAARDFAADLRAKYARVEFALKDAKVTVDKAVAVVSGKKIAAWRTSKYMTVPSGPFSGPDANFAGECLLFVPEGTESLVYLALTSKSGGTSLDRVIGDLSVKPTDEAAKAPRVVKLNDIFLTAADKTFPVRLIAYDSPPGFALTLDVVRIRAEIVYAEDRRDERRTVTGSIRLDQRDAKPDETVAAAAETERTTLAWGKPSAAVEVPLATEGVKTRVFRYTGTLADRAYTAQVAVLVMDDKVVRFTLMTYGDAALVEADAAAFDRLARSMQVAIRSK